MEVSGSPRPDGRQGSVSPPGCGFSRQNGRMCKIMKVLIDLLGAREHPDLHSLCRSCGGQPPWPNNTGESARRAALRHGHSRQLVRRIADRQARCARATSADPASTRSGPERPAPECSLHRDREPHGGGRMWRTRLRTEMVSVASGHLLWGIGESSRLYCWHLSV